MRLAPELGENLGRFKDLLAEASAAIDQNYFLLPVADAEGGEPIVQYRERVYAYELYHQLRSRWPFWPYSLGGEVDKRGHPLIRGGDLNNAKPDLLVHIPGSMENNLAVIEIKALRPIALREEETAIEKDVRKLIAFMENARYAAGFLLTFGADIGRILDYGQNFRRAGINIDMVELWNHAEPGTVPRQIRWGV
jgi:hypothetical protein